MNIFFILQYENIGTIFFNYSYCNMKIIILTDFLFILQYENTKTIGNYSIVYYAQKQLKTFVQKNNEFFKSFY